ncbi:hypothetical protein TNCV_1793151 [Trichonephila clavipes]|nr:hypothetical protein TNCV_1793151 [Trichonephila clavipes]
MQTSNKIRLCHRHSSRYTNFLKLYHRKKSNGVRSGDHGNRRTGPQSSIQWPGIHIQPITYKGTEMSRNPNTNSHASSHLLYFSRKQWICDNHADANRCEPRHLNAL